MRTVKVAGTGFLVAGLGVDEQAAKRAGARFEGQWTINDGWLRMTMPTGIVILQVDLPDDKTLRLFDDASRIEQGYVYRRI